MYSLKEFPLEEGTRRDFESAAEFIEFMRKHHPEVSDTVLLDWLVKNIDQRGYRIAFIERRHP